MQGAEGADLEKKQILEDQCRAASETLFKKRRELQKLQKDYDDDAKRLMDIKTRKKQMQGQEQELAQAEQKFEEDMKKQDEQIDKAQKTY